MKKFLTAAIVAAVFPAAPVFAASAVNLDSEAHFITVTEGASQEQLAVGANQTIQFCLNGCFVTLPNGDREALTGTEIIEITGGGQVRVRLAN